MKKWQNRETDETTLLDDIQLSPHKFENNDSITI